jgi:cytoplasmic iron level regulating protein YaaA (DUF328/UPF0246 family)
MPKLHILLAPSETKSEGGSLPPVNTKSFVFSELFDKRLEIIEPYKELIKRHDMDELQKKFGIKKAADIEAYCIDVATAPTKKAIERYTGVAFDYIDYEQLDATSKHYIDEQVILFSNLFGPVLASDHLPYYKLKQGEKLEGIGIDAHYKKYFTQALDDYLDGDVIDLRAGVYEKFYKISKPYTTFKFLKEGKVVSHWAKAYRGKLVKVLAENSIENIEELKAVLPEDMKLTDIQTTKLKTEWIIEVG